MDEENFHPDQTPVDAVSKQPQNTVYVPEIWLQYRDLLQHLCHYSNLLLMLIGPKGIGKTTFNHWFIQQLDKNYKTLLIDAKDNLTKQDIPQIISEKFNIKARIKSSDELQVKIQKQLAVFHTFSTNFILLIDNAHLLTDEVIDTLASIVKLQYEDQARLHIILSGDSELNQHINQHHHDIAHTIQFEPLSQDQIKSYLVTCFSNTNMPGDLPISKKQLQKIYHASCGIPEKINQYMMLQKSSNKPFQSFLGGFTFMKNKLIGGVAIAVAIVIAIVISLSVGKKGTQPPKLAFTQSSPTQQHNSTNKSKALISNLKPVQEQQQTQAVNQVYTQPKQATDQQSISSQSKPHQALVNQENSPSSRPAISQKTQPSNPAPRVAVKPNSRVSANSETQKQLAVLNSVKAQKANTTVQAKPAREEMSAQETAAYLKEQAKLKQAMQQFKSVIVTRTKEEEQAAAVAKKQQTANAKPETKKITAKPIVSGKEKQLLSSNKQNYTLQLLGAHNKQAIERFVKKHGLEQQTKIYRGSLEGKAWYVLTYGEYQSVSKAHSAIRNLPADIQKLKPWVKTTG